MKTYIIHQKHPVKSGIKLIILFTLLFSVRISAQQKFTIQLTNGNNQQLQIEGLKLTFDNNGKFICWQNGSKQDINFSSVGKIYFTDMVLPANTEEIISPGNLCRVYPNPSQGIISIEINQNYGKKTVVVISNLSGSEIFRKELTNVFNFQVDLSNQASGVYLLKVFNDDHQYINKIIIQK